MHHAATVTQIIDNFCKFTHKSLKEAKALRAGREGRAVNVKISYEAID